MQTVLTEDGGYFNYVYDAGANDSDKAFSPGTGFRWKLQGIRVVLATTATVGNRRLRVDVYVAGPTVLWSSGLSANIAAGATAYVHFQPDINDTATATDQYVKASFPDISSLKGFSVRVWDTAAIDAAADDMTVTLIYRQFAE